MSWSIGSPAGSRSNARAADAAGFTLIEVVVALAVAALLLVALSRALGLGAVATARVHSAEGAALLAQSALEPLGVAAPLRDGDTADLADGGYRIHVAVDRYADGDAPRVQGYLALYRLSATVRWNEGQQEHTLTLTTLRLGPPG